MLYNYFRNWGQRPNVITKDAPVTLITEDTVGVLGALCQELEWRSNIYYYVTIYNHWYLYQVKHECVVTSPTLIHYHVNPVPGQDFIARYVVSLTLIPAFEEKIVFISGCQARSWKESSRIPLSEEKGSWIWDFTVAGGVVLEGRCRWLEVGKKVG